MTTAPDSDVRDRARETARALQDLHRTLLEYQRREYEKFFGRIASDFYLLQLAAEDAQFAWLRALAAEMMRIDVAVGAKEPVSETDLRLMGTRVRYLLTPEAGGTSFQSHYDRAMQTNPEIVMAHARALRSLPPSREPQVFRSQAPTDIRTWDEVPGFEVRFHHPGDLLPGHGDNGYHALATIGESFLEPGTVIPMHRHANEEIVSWVPEGVMRHDDSAGNQVVIDRDRLLVMNAGTGIEHAELTRDDDPELRMLQIFIRPSAVQLDPVLQHAGLPPVEANTWRKLVGAEGSGAPFGVRNSIVMLDAVLDADSSTQLPRREGWDTLFFVHDGDFAVDEIPFGRGESGLVRAPSGVRVSSRAGARVVAFLIDPAAKVTRAGTIGR
jgi:quercetin 2,3-dioxygenase